MRSFPLFINGEFRYSKLKQKIINPAAQEVIAETSTADKNDVKFALDAARKAFDRGSWRNISLAERKEFLLKISKGILDKAAELARLETINSGKPIKETTFMDVPSSAQTFEYFANNLEEFLEGSKITLKSQIAAAESRLIREPRGVTVLIVPWNYPLLIASWKMAQSLAAGNTVILKPSSSTPLTALELGRITAEAGLPKGTVNILSGEAEMLGSLLCQDKRVDMISFTGSNRVGRKILQYSAENVKKMVMELGGKSASIVLKDADLPSAVNGCLCSIFLNQGQMCTAMSRIFVEDDIYGKFIDEFVQKAKRIKLGNGRDYETQMGPLISHKQREKVIDYVERAKQKGAKLLAGGKIPSDSNLAKGFFFEPTVFTQVSPQAAIFKEEVFGPVVCVDKFSNRDEAIELMNKSDFALAACLWTKDIALAQDLAAKINAGTVWVNTYGMFYNELPYGGFKQSGFGKELGREGFYEYTRLKNVIADGAEDAKPLVSYWYGF